VIRFLKRSEIDDKQWDECITQSFNGIVYAYSWFLDIVADEWNALVENDYERVFPLVMRRKWRISYIYQPFFTQQLGLFSRTILTTDILTGFLNSIPHEYKRVELNLNTHNKADGKMFPVVPQLNHELDLISSYEHLAATYSTNLKRNLKKAAEAHLKVVKNLQPEGIIELFRMNRGKDIFHLKGTHYLTLKRLMYTSIFKGKGHVWGVTDKDNHLCAGAFFIQSNRKVIFLFSGLDEGGKKAGAMPFLIDSYLREHSHKNLTFDFDGSNDPDLARFYKSFGAKECHYQRLIIDRLPLMLKPAFRIVRWYRGMASKYL
jgi:hypothetical protein